MRRLVLEAIQVNKFKSFWNETTVELTTNPGLKYVTGDNQAEPGLGANGCGKTTLYADAIIWCWTGQTIKGGKASSAVAYNEKQPYVATYFYLDDGVARIQYTIERSGSPERILLNGERVTQSVIDELILPRAQLLHSLVIGQAVPMFYDMLVSERGVLFDSIMKLDIWTKAGDLARMKLSAIEKECQRLAVLRATNQGATEQARQTVENLNESHKTWTATYESNRAQWYTKIQTLQQTSDMLTHEISILQVGQVSALNNCEAANTRERALRDEHVRLTAEQAVNANVIAEATAKVEHFETATECPTCGQAIYPHVAHAHITDNSVKCNEYTRRNYEVQQRLEQIQHELEATINWSRKYFEAANSAGNAILRLQQNIQNGKLQIQELESYIEQNTSPYEESIRQLLQTMHELTIEIRNIEHDLAEAEAEAVHLSFWHNGGFKRARLFQVERRLALLEAHTSHAAAMLGIADWRISFAPEMETKSGTLRPGIYINVANARGEQLNENSEGEKQRIRLAVALGVSSLIQHISGLEFALEIWDEPSAWLSPIGVEDLLTCLRNHALNNERSVWLLDHRVMDFNFDERWIVIKTTDYGSYVERLA